MQEVILRRFSWVWKIEIFKLNNKENVETEVTVLLNAGWIFHQKL